MMNKRLNLHLFRFILTILTICPHVSKAKVSSGKALLNGANSEALLTKFAVSGGTRGLFNLTLTIPPSRGMYMDERSLRVHLFVDHAWTKNAAKASTCPQKVQFAAKAIPVTFDFATLAESEEKVWMARVETHDLVASGEDTRYWYITLDDCSLEYTNYSEKDVPEMDFTYSIYNGDGKGGYSHFSADELGMTTLHLIQILFSSLLLLCIATKIIRAMRTHNGQIHIALLTVGCALHLDILSVISEMIHSQYYEINGIGIYSFDCLASHLEAQCDALIALVLILVGSGWTLPSDVVVKGDQNMSLLGTTSVIQKLVAGLRSPSIALSQLMSGNPASIFLFFILISHAILAQWGRTFDEEFDSYHALDHVAGRAVAFFRIFLGLIFLIGAASVRNSGRCPRTLLPFLTKFQIVGLTWFISLPFVGMVATSSLPDYRKHLAMATGSSVVQACSLASLVWLFCADSSASAYHRLSSLSRENDLNFSSGAASSSNGSDGGASALGSSGARMWKLGKTKIRLD